MIFYPFSCLPDKPVLVCQLGGAALENVAVIEKAIQHRGDSIAIPE